MTLKGGTNHYNVKFLKGYGFSVKLKDSKIILTNGYNPFSNQQDKEEWFISSSSDCQDSMTLNGMPSFPFLPVIYCMISNLA
ncbi:MAG: hypothetical protein HZA82_07540 [Thaumarchaeota archaeon]|nr:hypothetical protein [Nitrososphaerota archaeon]